MKRRQTNFLFWQNTQRQRTTFTWKCVVATSEHNMKRRPTQHSAEITIAWTLTFQLFATRPERTMTDLLTKVAASVGCGMIFTDFHVCGDTYGRPCTECASNKQGWNWNGSRPIHFSYWKFKIQLRIDFQLPMLNLSLSRVFLWNML